VEFEEGRIDEAVSTTTIVTDNDAVLRLVSTVHGFIEEWTPNVEVVASLEN
jgi:hypothetical protein